MLKNNYKNRSFESISNYLKQFEVLINSFENDNDEDALANLDVKATFDLVVEVVKKLKFVVGRDLQEKLTNLKTVDETLDDEEANDFVKNVSGKFVKFYKNFVRMIHEKTKTFSLINLRQLMLDLQKVPDNGPVRAKVTKQIKALIKSFINLMSDYFYKFPDLFKEGDEEKEVNLSSIFEENNDENSVLEIDATSPTDGNDEEEYLDNSSYNTLNNFEEETDENEDRFVPKSELALNETSKDDSSINYSLS